MTYRTESTLQPVYSTVRLEIGTVRHEVGVIKFTETPTASRIAEFLHDLADAFEKYGKQQTETGKRTA